MSWLVGVDVGGTFTDFYAFDPASGAAEVYKRPSTPENPALAILAGLEEMAAAKGFALADIGRLGHGTTVATNALIQRKGGKVAVLTTKGFRDLLEIGRQIRPHMYDLQADNPPPLVPRERRFEVAERITAGGRVVQPLDRASLEAAVREVVASGAEACAVCFLFSFADPAHERQAGAALAAAAPELAVSLSSEVQPEFREYERLSTTVLNAYLQPLLARYIGDLASRLEAAAPRTRVGIFQSNGGLMSLGRARQFPVRTALSGPAAGAVGAVEVAHRAGRADVITLDMGGTSADVCLIRDYETGIGFDRDVAGFPVRLPMVDINTIGAGGGSVAWFDRDGLLKVGPASAGADPGPACYGRGGDRPTVTDANLVLGRLAPAGLLGGAMRLDAAKARAVLEPVAARLGFSVERTALGILGIVVANMVRAIRTVSVERGHDPRKYALMPFGGAGGLHAVDVARALGMRIVVPPSPGILCAEGLLASDLKEDFVATVRAPLAEAARGPVEALLAELRGRTEEWFAAERVEPARRALRLSLDMRYVGQNFELQVPAGSGDLPATDALRRGFYEAHDRSYGFHSDTDAVEIVNLRLTASGGLGRLAARRAAPATEKAAPVGSRRVWFAPDAPVDAAVYDRARLAPAHEVAGPAVIDQFDSTTLLHPGDRARVDDALNLLIETKP